MKSPKTFRYLVCKSAAALNREHVQIFGDRGFPREVIRHFLVGALVALFGVHVDAEVRNDQLAHLLTRSHLRDLFRSGAKARHLFGHGLSGQHVAPMQQKIGAFAEGFEGFGDACVPGVDEAAPLGFEPEGHAGQPRLGVGDFDGCQRPAGAFKGKTWNDLGDLGFGPGAGQGAAAFDPDLLAGFKIRACDQVVRERPFFSEKRVVISPIGAGPKTRITLPASSQAA